MLPIPKDLSRKPRPEAPPRVQARHVHRNIKARTRGAIVHITGRLKCNRYVDANGNDRVQYEIVARKLEVMKEDRV